MTDDLADAGVHLADAGVHLADAGVHLADAAVGILGLGYAGSPLTVAFAGAGLCVESPLVVAIAGAGLCVADYDLSADPGTTGRVPANVDVV